MKLVFESADEKQTFYDDVLMEISDVANIVEPRYGREAGYLDAVRMVLKDLYDAAKIKTAKP